MSGNLTAVREMLRDFSKKSGKCQGQNLCIFGSIQVISTSTDMI